MSVIDQSSSPRNLVVEDVTETMHESVAAFELVASNYSKFCSQPQNLDRVYHQLCEDEFSNCGRTRTILVFDEHRQTDPSQPRRRTDFTPLATARLIIGTAESKPGGSILEMMDLVEPVGGWEPLYANGFRPEDCVEIGRMAISEHLGRASARRDGSAEAVFSMVYHQFAKMARLMDKSLPWALMHQSLARLLSLGGVTFSEKLDVTFYRDRHDDLFRQFDRYWVDGKVHLYRFQFPDK